MSWDDGMYKKYRVEHTDGTPLKGKKYFVLRLDSDNPTEAARVTAAMRAYKGRLRNCDVGTALEQSERFMDFCRPGNRPPNCEECKVYPKRMNKFWCQLEWAQMPYTAKEGETDGV